VRQKTRPAALLSLPGFAGCRHDFWTSRRDTAISGNTALSRPARERNGLGTSKQPRWREANAAIRPRKSAAPFVLGWPERSLSADCNPRDANGLVH
jgi:hypothetical protein